MLCAVIVVAERRRLSLRTNFKHFFDQNTLFARLHCLQIQILTFMERCIFFFSRYLHVDYLSTEKRRFAPLATLLYSLRGEFPGCCFPSYWCWAGRRGAACNSVMPGRDHSRSHHFLSPKQQHALLSYQGRNNREVFATKRTLFLPSLMSQFLLTVMSRSNQKPDIAMEVLK